ncbi:MAG: BTAD domain-containing putative transcriptional regulator, partial [Acidimicrobiales bacterium]
MWFGILGPLEARRGESMIDLGPPKQRAVLAVLLVEANRVVPVERLARLLWDEERPARATGALQVYISGLRQALEPDRPTRMRSGYVVTQAPGYLLRVGPDELDSERFLTLASEGRVRLGQGDAAGARRVLAESLALWRGPALADFADEPFATREIARLEELKAAAVEDRVEADLTLGRHAQAVAELEFLIGEQPRRERLWALLMLALYRSERQSEALQAAARARVLLREELGIEPGPMLRQMEHDILRQAPELGAPVPAVPTTFPPYRPPAPAPAAESAPGTDSSRAGVSSRGLVGRDDELRLFDQRLAEVRSGRGSVVLVSGEPGIGKTRLVEEVVARAADQSTLVVWGACDEGQGAPSFWPWVQVIRGLIAGVDPEVVRPALEPGAGEIAQIVPDVKDLVPDVEPPAAVDPGVARAHLFRAVHGLVTGVAASTPLVVVLEDVHWADLPSLHLMEFVAHRTAASPLLLVPTFRDADPAVGGPLAAVVGGLGGRPSCHRITLGGLSEAECGLFINETVGVTPSPAVAATVYARTDGNPFFVVELARLLSGEDALTGDLAPDVRVPAGVRDVIRERLGRIPAPTRELLGQAAILGRDLDASLLAAAGRIEEDEVAERLDPALASGLLVPAPALRFSHALVQETIQAEMTDAACARAHVRAAAALRVAYGDDRDHAVERAHHLLAAAPDVDLEEAFAAARVAAEVSERRLAYEQAEELLRRALVAVRYLPPSRERTHNELEVCHRLATLLSVTHGYHSDAVAAVWSEARELSRQLGDTPEVLNSIWGLARLTRTRGQFAVSVRFGEELLALAEGSPAPLFALAGHETLGMAALFTGDVGEAERHLVKVTENCGAGAGADLIPVLIPGIACRCYLACARWLAGDAEEADALLANARSVAQLVEHRLTEAITFLYSAKLATMKGCPEEVAHWTDEVARLAADASLGPLETAGDVLAGWADAHLGDPHAGLDRIGRSNTSLRASGWRLAMTYFMWLQADASRAAGRHDLALAAVERGLAEAEATGEHYYEAELCRLAGEVSAAMGRPDVE